MIKLGNTFADARICILDDDTDNVSFLKSILEWSGYTNYVGISDSSTALSSFKAYRPDLIILDLHMPKPTGYDLLKSVREDEFPGEYLPVIALTGDVTMETKTKTLNGGATDFLIKPVDALEILLRIRNLLEARQMHLQLSRYQEHLEQEVRDRTADLSLAHLGALAALARAGELRDDDTGEHTHRVSDVAAGIARLLGKEGSYVEAIRITAPLHDVGKIAIPDSILLKPGKLTPEEFEVMKGHTTAGAQILSTIEAPTMNLARCIALSHHERWNGTGYPHGIANEDIPLSARIVAVADVYDALTHERPYKRAWSHEDAVTEIKTMSGSFFDPRIVKAFLELVES